MNVQIVTYGYDDILSVLIAAHRMSQSSDINVFRRDILHGQCFRIMDPRDYSNEALDRYPVLSEDPEYSEFLNLLQQFAIMPIPLDLKTLVWIHANWRSAVDVLMKGSGNYTFIHRKDLHQHHTDEFNVFSWYAVDAITTKRTYRRFYTSKLRRFIGVWSEDKDYAVPVFRIPHVNVPWIAYFCKHYHVLNVHECLVVVDESVDGHKLHYYRAFTSRGATAIEEYLKKFKSSSRSP